MIAALLTLPFLVVGDSVSLKPPEWWPNMVAVQLGVQETVVSGLGWSTRRWNTAEGFDRYAPYLDMPQVQILLGLNDKILGVSAAEYRTNLLDIVADFSGQVAVHLPWDSGQEGSLAHYRAVIETEEMWILGADLSGIPLNLLSADGVHPTEAGQAWIAEKVVALIPEPSTAALLLFGVTLLGYRGRRGHEKAIDGTR